MDTTTQRPGVFISFEGIDGSGKSTIAAKVQNYFTTASGPVVHLIRQPGNSSIGKQVREMIFNPELDRSAASILIQADRVADIAENIKPALDRGEWVICDRYLDSTTAYQGYGEGWSLDLVNALNRTVARGCVPDITFLLDVDPVCGIERAAKDSAFYTHDQVTKLDFIRRGYLEIAAANPNRFIVVATTDVLIGEVEYMVLDQITKYLDSIRVRPVDRIEL